MQQFKEFPKDLEKVKCDELGCKKHRVHADGCPLTKLEVDLYMSHGYFGGKSNTSGGRVMSISYYESPLRKS